MNEKIFNTKEWSEMYLTLQKLYDNKCKKEQDLIKYLEGKIKEYKDSELFSSAGKVTAYQEILNKIKEGNYE